MNAKSDKNICRICIKQTGGCCVFPLESGWKIPILPSEVFRIAEYTGKEIPQFLDTTPLVKSQMDYYLGMHDDIWARLFSIWQYPTGIKGRCHFLGRKGCMLPYNIKPFICQVFPLDFNITRNTIVINYSIECLLLQSLNSCEKVTEYFGDDFDALKHRYKVFMGDLILLLDHLEKARQSNQRNSTYPILVKSA
jgi:Fe-S-cluster containining protein